MGKIGARICYAKKIYFLFIFLEFMGKQNVQNLMSFYLNAEMFRQFARKELAKCSAESTTVPKPDARETQLSIKDFAKGLINSYLLSAVNFTAMSQDEVKNRRLDKLMIKYIFIYLFSHVFL